MSLKKKKEVKVNLGCGSNIIKGWINIDKYKLDDNLDFLEGDAMDIPLEKNSVDYLICDQVLEHIPMAQVVTVLQEIRRVLKPGGRAVIIVPDFKDAAEEWLKHNHDVGYNPFTYHYLSEVIYGNQIHEGEFHKTPFSSGFFNHVLHIAGFSKFQLLLYPRNGIIPKYDGVPNYGENMYLRNSQLVADITK